MKKTNLAKIFFLSLIILISFLSPNVQAKKKYTKPDSKVVQHIFFRDKFRNNRLNAHLVKVDLKNPRVRLEIALAYNNTNRKEKVSRMAERVGAIAAINGSFFHSTRTVDSAVGIIMANRNILSDSGHRRTSLGITDTNEIVIGIPKIKNMLIFPEIGRVINLNSINQARGKKHTTLYTTYFGSRTKTKTNGREIIVSREGRVIDYKTKNSFIPPGGFVISIAGAGKEVVKKYPLGTYVYLDTLKSQPWDDVNTIITGSPQLVKNGRIYNSYFQEKLQKSLKYPTTRTALGITHNKELLMLTVSGRLTLSKLAEIMKRLGARDALALDGGGSTEMYLGGKTIITHNRPVTNALVVKLH